MDAPVNTAASSAHFLATLPLIRPSPFTPARLHGLSEDWKNAGRPVKTK